MTDFELATALKVYKRFIQYATNSPCKNNQSGAFEVHKVSMTRKCHNHRLQIRPWHREEDTQTNTTAPSLSKIIANVNLEI